MAHNTQAILIDKNGKPIPQYFNQLADAYQPLQGEHGAARNILYGADGQPVSVVSNKLAVRAAELETALAQILTGDNFDAKADIKMSALRDAITAAGGNAKTLKDLHDKLTSLETEIKAIKDTAGIKKINDTVDVQLTGSNMELYGASINDRPAANTVPAGATFTIVDRDLDKNWISDGTNWEEV